MESFEPEFAEYWLESQAASAGEAKTERPVHDASAQRAALEELAERVTLARSVY